MKGGSKASNLVMDTSNPKLCDSMNEMVNIGPEVKGDINNLSLYRTTGGGKKSKAKHNKKKSQRKKSQRKKSQRKKSQRKRARRRSKCRHCGMMGGSPASNLLFKQVDPKYCDSTGPVLQGLPIPGSLNNINNYQTTGGGKQTHGGVSNNCLGLQNGGGSDWRTTVYSRGPVNTTNMDPRQFRMFTQNAEYMSNDALRTQNFLKGGRRRMNRIRSDRR